MDALAAAAGAAVNLIAVFVVGWLIVLVASQYVERRLRRGKGGGPGVVVSVTWLWDNANIIGIPTLLVGTTYLLWAMYLGPGLSVGPTMLVIFLMAAAGLLIGFAPSVRRGGRAPR